MKKIEAILNEYVKRLSDEDLSFLRIRMTQNLGGDRAEISNFLAKDHDIDRWLSTATGAEDFFDMLDYLTDFVVDESDRRDRR